MNRFQVSIVGIIAIVLFSAGFFIFTSDPVDTQAIASQPAPELEVLSDRIVVRVPATEMQLPATTSPAQPDGPQSDWYKSAPISFPDDVVITGFQLEVEGADFSALHHANVGLTNRIGPLCTDQTVVVNSLKNEFFTASRDSTDEIILPEPYGIVWQANDELVVEFMTHLVAAPHGPFPPDEKVQPTLKMTIFTDETRTVAAHFLRLRLDDTPCEYPMRHEAFAVPASDEPYLKQTSDSGRSDRYTFPRDGKVIVAGSNFWARKGGKNVTSYINGQVMHVSKAIPGEVEWEWDIPYKTLNIPFQAGDEISITSLYENPFPDPVKDASGMYGFYYTYGEPIEID